MFLIAAGLVLLASAQTPSAYLAAWVVLGLGMSAGLYDAAFSTLGRLYGRDARAAITQLTLWGGFASTVCWPITAWLVESVGWRGTCLAYAGLHLAVTLPLSLFLMPRTPPAEETSPDHIAGARGAPGPLDLRFLCIAAAGVCPFDGRHDLVDPSRHHPDRRGLHLAAAIAVGTLIGPAQVGARVLEMLGRGRHHPIWTMAAAATLVLMGFLGLLFGIPAAAALVAYGAGNGLWSIARGALPLALFGPGSYAKTMGRLATPMLIAGAAAPTIGGLLIEFDRPRRGPLGPRSHFDRALHCRTCPGSIDPERAKRFGRMRQN